jgi:diguanylate cyclase (GGDEF)-like protein
MKAGTSVDREVSGLLVRAVMRYVERAVGEHAVAEVLRHAGLEQRVESLDDTTGWFTIAEIRSLADVASELTGDSSIGRRMGEEQVLDLCEQGLRDMLVAQGSVAGAMELVLASAVKMSNGRTFDIVDRGHDRLLVEAVTLDPSSLHPLFCDYVHGIFAVIPTVFGVVARVIEPTCQVRGDDRCRFEVSWSSDPRVEVTVVDAEASAARFEERIASLESVQQMASDLLASHDLEGVLDRICDGAATTLQAPRFLLAVRVGTTERLRVHHRGFPDDGAAVDAANDLLAGRDVEGASVLVTDVNGTSSRYGVLAVCGIPGTTFSSWERRTIEAFARHATAALDIVVALDGAERDRDAARALLDLAVELAEVGTSDEVAARLTKVVPRVVRCEVAMLWNWDAERGMLQLRAVTSRSGQKWDGPMEVAAGDVPLVDHLVASPEPLLIGREHLPVELRSLMDDLNVESAAIVPISVRGTLLGILTASFATAPSEDDLPHLLTGLVGLAGHAAQALENARLLEDVRHQALHDRLTDLPNRPMIEDRANACLAAFDGRPVSLLFIDLDRFKNVNDTLGHGAGDELIRMVAHRLREVMRGSDTLARLGGDEFVVLLPDASADIAHRVADRIAEVLRAPFMLAGRQVYISCSIGIASAPDDGDTYEELLGRADAAMYDAKARGRNTIAVHHDDGSDGRDERLALETALHHAIELDQLQVHYQPQVDLATGDTVSVEALVRWQHPELGLLTPDRFLQLAEDTGLIVDIDRHVRRTAFAQAATWAAAGHPIRVAVNLSTRDIVDDELPARLRAEIEEAGVSPALIELEVTERVEADDDGLTEMLDRLRALGVRLAIDDFGTGTSVIARLQRHPINTLKIDRSLVQSLGGDAADELVVKALVTLGTMLGLDVVAEGVETDAQLALLRGTGCTLAQGFLFSRPVPAESIDATRQLAAGARLHADIA